MNKTLKKIIIVLVVLVIIGIGASFFAGDKTSNQNPLQSIVSGGTGAILTQNATTNQNFANTEEINREFIATLLNLQAIKLNDDIFSQPAFTVLVDNSVRLNQPGNHGRPNPFAPIGLDPVASPEALDMQASVSSSVLETQPTTPSVTEIQTTLAGEPWPSGWITWQDTIQNIVVTKIGPVFSETNYILFQAPTSLQSSLSSTAECVGDSEIMTCRVGSNSVVNTEFEAQTYFD